MKIAVVILNWNGRLYLEAFLPNVIQTCEGKADVIIADNQSTDDSISFLKNHYPQLRILHNGGNLGYAAGYNAALSQIQAEYYVLLNSDIEVVDNWIDPVISIMDSDKAIAACQPKILSFRDRNKFEYAGAAGGFIDQFGYPFCRGRLFQSIEYDRGQYDDVREVFWATGACLFVRAEYFWEVGGLDVDFFAHMEEIDICWRFKHLGYKIMYCGKSKVFHVGGGSLDKSSPKKTYLNIRNNNTMIYKNLPTARLYQIFLARFFLDLLAAFKFLVDGGFGHFVAVLRAHFGFYVSYKKNRFKRRNIEHRDVTHIYQGNIVFDYFFKGKRFFSDLKPSRFRH